jgi:zinc protease
MLNQSILCTAFALAALASAPLTASAQSIDVPYTTFTLDNGLKVIVHEDHSDAVVAIYVSYHVGSGREELGKSGFAHLFEHMLFQGSEHVGDDMHFKYVSEAGGTLNGTTNTDRTVYFETLPANQLEVALWLEADRMGFLLPAITQATLDNQIDVVKNERRQNYENRPYGQGEGAIVAALYPKGHPYSWLTIGSHEDLTSASIDDVKGFFTRWYGPNNATLAIGGDVKLAEVRTLVERWFGPIPRGPVVDDPSPRPVKLDAVKRIAVEDRVKLPQLEMVWPSVPMGADDEAALDALAEILTENKGSALMKPLMMDEQLASSVRASSDTQELAGTFDITVRAQKGVSLDTLEERMQKVLADIAKNGIDPDALQRAKTRYASGFVRRLETVSTRTAMLANANTLDGRPDAYKDTYERRMAVTPADVQRVLRHYVLGRPAVVLSTVPKGMPEMAAKDKPFPPPIEDEIVAVDRTTKPGTGRTPPFHQPDVWHATAGGLPVAGVKWTELPMSTLSIAIPAGRTRETPANLGISSFTASMLEQGTQSLDAIAYADELDRLGAFIRVGAGDDELTISVSALDAQFPDAIRLMTDVILHPRFDPADFERLKKERTTAIETRSDQIRVIAGDVFDRLIYGDDASAGRPSLGTKDTVAALSLDGVKSFWKSFGVPSGARMSYVGALDGAALSKALEPLTSAWKGGAPPPPQQPKAPAIAKTRLYLVDKPGAAQSEIRIGHIGPSSKDREFYALSVVDYPLGGAFSSRINMNLREKHGYTYGARSSFQGGLEPGEFVASAGVKTDVTAESVTELMNELRAIGEGVKPEELAFTKDALSMSARRQYEATGALIGMVDNASKFGWPDDYPKQRLAELDAMTTERFKELAQKWIHPDAMVILVVGDKSKVGEKLAKLGYGEPIELDVDGNPVSGSARVGSSGGR